MTPFDEGDLRRRLVDLADGAGPWDDPLPEVLHRSALAAPPSRLASRWWRAPHTLLVAAAVVLLALVGGGWLLNSTTTPQNDTSAAGGSAGMQAQAAKCVPSVVKSGSPAAQPSTASVQLTSALRVRTGAATRVSIQLPARTPAGAAVELVVLDQSGAAVGRLDTAGVGGPNQIRVTGSTIATGVLRASPPSCGTATGGTAAATGAGAPLAPGRYFLVALATFVDQSGAAHRLASAPSPITVTTN
jgi:hypothetical protein